MDSLLKDKTELEKIDIKTAEIEKESFIGVYERELRIEIKELVRIDGGIQIVARAWRGDKQLGFSGGHIEFERFKYYNPPVLVDDPKGDIVRIYEDENGIKKERRLRSDPKEAVLQILEQTIQSVGKEDTNIIYGSIGSTVSTFYPQAGSGGGNTTCDGRGSVTNKSTWSGARDQAVADAVATSETTQFTSLTLKVSASSWYVYRCVYTFDTSSISPDTISAAEIQLYDNETGLASQNDDGDSVEIVSAALANSNDYVVGDYDSFGTTSFGSLALASKTDNAYNTWTLNASGIADINISGVSEFFTIMETDRSNTTPTGRNQMSVFFADETGTTKDPKLVVTHSSGTAYTKELTDVITLVDFIATKITAKIFSETITLVDSVINSSAKVFTETLTLADTCSKLLITSINLLEDITILDTKEIKQTAKGVNESITIVDTIDNLLIINKLLTEVITLVIVFTIGKQLTKTISETLSLVVSIVKDLTAGIIFKESLSIVDKIFGLLNGVNMKYNRKYDENADDYVDKYNDV